MRPVADPLERALAARGWILADGGVATGLFARGLPLSEAPETWLAARPDQVRALHAASIAAGCGLIVTNSFGANALRLAGWGAEDRVSELNRAAAGLARAAAGPSALVAGSIGPTGLRVGPDGLAVAAAAEVFAAQARALLEGGADLLWVETLGSAEELAAAALGVAQVGAPWCATLSFEADGRTRDGLAPTDLVALAEALAPAPRAYGANCGAGPETLLATLDALRAAGARRPLVAKANAGIPRVVAGRLAYEATEAAMASYALAARARGAAVIGGCCGVTAAHLRAMDAALTAAAERDLGRPPA